MLSIHGYKLAVIAFCKKAMPLDIKVFRNLIGNYVQSSIIPHQCTGCLMNIFTIEEYSEFSAIREHYCFKLLLFTSTKNHICNTRNLNSTIQISKYSIIMGVGGVMHGVDAKDCMSFSAVWER